MKKRTKGPAFVILTIIITSCIGWYAYTLQSLIRSNKGRAVYQYIMECEGTTITEYVMEDHKEYFSIRCEELPPQYIEL